MSEKWALLIGINAYRYAEEAGFHRLQGCRDDVASLRALLVGKYGFPPANIRTLLDSQATRSAILHAIQDDMVAKAGPEDIVAFYYSGHGSECYDAARINSRDQTLVPHDGRDPGGEIADL